MEDLTRLKTDLFHINLEVHNFLADFYSNGINDQQQRLFSPQPPRRENQTMSNLKDRIVRVYALWDETFHL